MDKAGQLLKAEDLLSKTGHHNRGTSGTKLRVEVIRVKGSSFGVKARLLLVSRPSFRFELS